MANGIDARAKGKKGNYLVLSEYTETDNGMELKTVKCQKVDGKKIKEDVLYHLVNGEFVACGSMDFEV